MDDKNKMEELRQQGWESMSAMLDEHMPQDEERGIVWWYWLAGAAAVLLLIVLPWMVWKDSGSSNMSVRPGTDQTITQEESGPAVFDTKSDEQTGSDQSPVIADNNTIVKNNTTGRPGRKNLQTNHGIEQRTNTFLTARTEKETKNVEPEMADQENNPKIAPDVSEGFAGSDYATRDLETYNLGMLSFFIQFSNRILPFGNTINSSEKITPDRKGQISGLVFSELMGSLSDAFGFVNAGPGIQYASGKWSVGLSAGVSMPLPDQKVFSSSNLEFSNQYSFDYAADSKVESGSLGFNNSSPVYYERYRMKPGWMASISVQYQIANHWGVSANLGRIGFRYDFTQRAEPNTQLAASTDVSNLRNSLWYGGLSVSYAAGNHWKLYGGARMINLLGAGDVGALPAVRVEYKFH